MRNLATALLVAQGIPMILMGDEYGHSKVSMRFMSSGSPHLSLARLKFIHSMGV